MVSSHCITECFNQNLFYNVYRKLVAYAKWIGFLDAFVSHVYCIVIVMLKTVGEFLRNGVYSYRDYQIRETAERIFAHT